MGGINTLLGLQATTGLNAQKQAGSVEAMRAASGYAYDTEQIAGMTKSLAGPQSSNQMFMMLGTGMYGIGGKQRTQQEVYQDIIKRTGLGNEKMLAGAFQQGSMTRSRLSMSGLAEDQQDLLLQYAQQNIAYQKKGGKGFYDPSKKSQRELMGVEGNYANQAEESTRVQANREENFYKRQNDNFANFEKMTQAATKALGMFEEKLSSISGAGIVSKKHRDVFGTSFNWGKKIGGAAMAIGGVATGNPILALSGAGLMAGGDPIDSFVKGRGRGRGIWGIRNSSSSNNNNVGGDASDGETAESSPKVKLSANNKRKLAQLDPKLRGPLTEMLAANPKLEIGTAKRSVVDQEKYFRQRYRPTTKPISEKGRNDRDWNGVVWERIPGSTGADLAAPGESNHQIGLAADVHNDDNWVRDNAAKFGLNTGATGTGGTDDEPFHVQPNSIPVFGNNKGGQNKNVGVSGSGTSTSSVSTASVGGGGVKGSVSSASLTPSQSFAYSGMSMGEVIGSGSVYASSGVKSTTPSSVSSSTKSTGGDPIDSPKGPLRMGSSTASSNSYNITVSPSFNIQSSGNGSFDIQKMAKDVANLLERELRMTMMRTV